MIEVSNVVVVSYCRPLIKNSSIKTHQQEQNCNDTLIYCSFFFCRFPIFSISNRLKLKLTTPSFHILYIKTFCFN